jgi:hypothetical protein
MPCKEFCRLFVAHHIGRGLLPPQVAMIVSGLPSIQRNRRLMVGRAHRDDERSAEASLLRFVKNQHRIGRPGCFEPPT